MTRATDLAFFTAAGTELLKVGDFGTIVLSSAETDYLFVGYQDEVIPADGVVAN